MPFAGFVLKRINTIKAGYVNMGTGIKENTLRAIFFKFLKYIATSILFTRTKDLNKKTTHKLTLLSHGVRSIKNVTNNKKIYFSFLLDKREN